MMSDNGLPLFIAVLISAAIVGVFVFAGIMVGVFLLAGLSV